MAEDLKSLEGMLTNLGKLEEEAAAKAERLRAERAGLEEKIRAAGGTPNVSVSEGNGNGNGNGDPTKKLTREEQLAETFSKMAPAESVKLYVEKPELFKEMMSAVEAVGIRNLLRGK